MDPSGPVTQRLRLRVVLGNEFDHEPGCKWFEEGGQVFQRLVSSESEVMDERECQDQVGPAAIEYRGALVVLPAKGRRGVEQVLDQRQEARLALALGFQVIPLDTGWIRLECDHFEAQLAGQAAEISRVGAQIPNCASGALLEEARDQASLLLKLVRRVGVLVVIGLPFAARGLPCKPRMVDWRLSTSPSCAGAFI